MKDRFKGFKSHAQWAPGVCSDPGDITTDDHETFAEAKGVCALLARDGFGGDRKFFPLKTWVTPITEAEKPSVNPVSNGWWWMWAAGEWCVASLQYAEYIGGGPAMRVRWMHANGRVSGDTLNVYEMTVRIWGGRLGQPCERKEVAA